MLDDRGRIAAAVNGHGEDPADGPSLGDAFPESVQAIIAARLDTLAPESKTLLLDAAVIGQTFWSGAVSALSGRDESDVRGVLHDLVRRDYLRPARVSTLAGQSEHSFAHALIMEVAYAQIPRVERAAKHEAAAWSNVDLAGDEPGEQAAVIAHHYDRARVLMLASGSGKREVALTS